ncbi:MAG: hypothetical protein ACLQIK_16415 [Mycobacterium sp.]|uniref:hypothetical protein n=1 Tax=Mycobacterium sp. TaxID=1785 RepID=UPI002C904FF0|nr:hypothetical protein [Mycobacterium sp.]
MAEMRQLHVYDCALTGVMPMRVILATMLVAGGLAVALVVVIPARAEPQTCPPLCDQIPDTAWIHQRALPLNAVAHVAGSTISELTLWSSGPPQVPRPAMADDPVLDAMTTPLCDAYIASYP